MPTARRRSTKELSVDGIEAAFQQGAGWTNEDDSISNYDDDDDLNSKQDGQARDAERQVQKEVLEAAKREIRGVRIWKGMFLIMALATSGIVSAGTYIFMKREEDDDYSESYKLFVSSMRDMVNLQVENIHMSLENMANVISTDAAAHGAEFPFYTMKNFEAVGEGARKVSKVEMIGWMPYVESYQILDWLNYSMSNQHWLQSSRQYVLRSGEFSVSKTDYKNGTIAPIIYDLDGPGRTPQPSQGKSPHATSWQTSPPVFNPQAINLDFNQFDFSRAAVESLEKARRGIFTRILVVGETGSLSSLIFKHEDHEKFHSTFVDWNHTAHAAVENPHGSFLQPVFADALDKSSKVVGYLASSMAWDAFMVNLLPDGVCGIDCVVRNSCGQAVTYRLHGSRAYFVGWDDFHDPAYDETEQQIPFYRPMPDGYEAPESECVFTFHIYATSEYEALYRSNITGVLTAVVAGAFTFLILCFAMYDWFVWRRNQKLLMMATKSKRIVSSLFPSVVRNRLYQYQDGDIVSNNDSGSKFEEEGEKDLEAGAAESVKESVTHSDVLDDNFMFKSSPIADLYPDATIMFADVRGFTQWSSSRQPVQVFMLLETLYNAFDMLARRRKVFKVETIGDCYVAVAGLPEPMPDHALVMARFARECLKKMRELTHKLEPVLGPDTIELDMRFGLHSGSVTAGVLRGEKSRFQLFGDAMNTASRMESTGAAGAIQVSQETADRLIAAGKSNWLIPREDIVEAKGKGQMRTYWVATSSKSGSMGSIELAGNRRGSNGSDLLTPTLAMSDVDQLIKLGSQADLITLNVGVFTKLLNQVAADRGSRHGSPNPLQAVEVPIGLEPAVAAGTSSPSPAALDQLRHFVGTVAGQYPKRPYHNFGHASHVVCSAATLFSELKTTDPASAPSTNCLMQVACVFAALLHDLSFPGGCVNAAWSLLMSDNYVDLRNAIYGTADEERMFHGMLKQSLQFYEKSRTRWGRMLAERGEEPALNDNCADTVDKQQLLLLEAIVQTSSMVYAMQRFDVYRKWNALLFEEVWAARQVVGDDPVQSWYHGELHLFDNVVLPTIATLAKGSMFRDGVAEAYTQSATLNRRRWEEQGMVLVTEMASKFQPTTPQAGSGPFAI